jgi:hypothetical protein
MLASTIRDYAVAPRRRSSDPDLDFETIRLFGSLNMQIPFVNAALLETHVEVNLGIFLVCPSLATSQGFWNSDPFSFSFFRLGPVNQMSAFISRASTLKGKKRVPVGT